MITTLKLAGLSAVLSAGLVGGMSDPGTKAYPGGAKEFYDRVDGNPSSPSVGPMQVSRRTGATEAVNAAAKGGYLIPRERRESLAAVEMRFDAASTSVLARGSSVQAAAISDRR